MQFHKFDMLQICRAVGCVRSRGGDIVKKIKWLQVQGSPTCFVCLFVHLLFLGDFIVGLHDDMVRV